MEFQQYIGLGDSISTDDYPGKGLGGISLFYRNDDKVHPGFHGKDLFSKSKSIKLTSLARDGATSSDVLEKQLSCLSNENKPTLVTLTVGGNDILFDVNDSTFEANLKNILSTLKSKYSNILILLGTIYDPSDYIGRFIRKDIARIYRLNKIIQAKSDDNIAIADIHKHFLGHGLPFSWIPGNNWYCGLIEPNRKGGSEVRRVFLNTLNRLCKE